MIILIFFVNRIFEILIENVNKYVRQTDPVYNRMQNLYLCIHNTREFTIRVHLFKCYLRIDVFTDICLGHF